jgi:sec-independent protein translocase protein TatA
MLEGLLSPMHLLLILTIALIVLGPQRLPEAGRGLGEALRAFKQSLNSAAENSSARDAEHNPAPSTEDAPAPGRERAAKPSDSEH